MDDVELPPEVLAFLDGMRVPCVISTLRADGSPITSATLFGLADGCIIVSTPGERTKARNVRRDPRVSFIVDSKERPYRGVAVEGRAEVLDDHDASLLRLIVERYSGPVSAEDLRARMESRGPRVILRIRPSRVRPWNLEPPP